MPWINKERKKYERIYATNPRRYGKRDHGRESHDIVLGLMPNTLLDVGCGKGRYVEWAKKAGIEAEGLDIASGYGINGDVCDMPFDDNSFDVVTAFDVLEHLREGDLHRGLLEMARVASNFWVLSIGYGPSRLKFPSEAIQLHPIAVKDPNWWIPHLSLYGKVEEKGTTRDGRPYLLVSLKGMSL